MTSRAHRPHPRDHDRRDAALRARWVHLWISVVMLAVCSAVAAWAGPLWAKVGWAIAALLHFLVFVALFRELSPVRLWASRSLSGSPWVRLVSWGAGSLSLTLGPVEVGVHYPASWASVFRVAALAALYLLCLIAAGALGVGIARLHTVFGGSL